MRFRVRPASGQTFRTEVSDASTFSELRQALGRQLDTDPASLRLSINKQTPLEGKAQDSLQTLGLSSGDLLFILDFTTTSTPAAPSAPPLACQLPPLARQLPSEAAHMDLAPSPPQPAKRRSCEPQQGSRAASATNAAAGPALPQDPSIGNCSSFMSQLQALWITVQTQLEDRGLHVSPAERAVEGFGSSSPAFTAVCTSSSTDLPQSSCELQVSAEASQLKMQALTTLQPALSLNLSAVEHVQLVQQAGSQIVRLPRWQQLHAAVSRFGQRLVLSLRQQAAASPLLSLPQEVQHKILRHLAARDLARVDCVCHMLHHISSQNALWQCLVQDVTPKHAPALTFSEPGSAKAAYAAHLQAQLEAQRQRCRLRHGYRLPDMSPAPPLWLGQPRPLMALGGDYDRLPGILRGGSAGHQLPRMHLPSTGFRF